MRHYDRRPGWVNRLNDRHREYVERRRQEEAALARDAETASLEELEAAEAILEGTKTEDTPCPACGTPEKALLADRGSLGHLARCRACHYTWTIQRGV